MGRDSSYKKPTDKILTIPIEPELHRRVRVQAAHEDISLKELGTKALQEYLDSHGQ